MLCKECSSEFSARRIGHVFCKPRCAGRYYDRHSVARTKRQTSVQRQQKARLLRIRAANFLGGQCQDCGTHDFRVFEFDHVPERGPKGADISFLCHKLRAWKHFTFELVKCDLVCANCHRIRTLNRGVQRGNYMDEYIRPILPRERVR